jgi:hypothetical protein
MLTTLVAGRLGVRIPTNNSRVLSPPASYMGLACQDGYIALLTRTAGPQCGSKRCDYRTAQPFCVWYTERYSTMPYNHPPKVRNVECCQMSGSIAYACTHSNKRSTNPTIKMEQVNRTEHGLSLLTSLFRFVAKTLSYMTT